ncbi:MAG: indole-3-glycerol phosphate synthase TrpC [Acidimicrobiales bacterium]
MTPGRSPGATYLSGIIAAHRARASRDMRDPVLLESAAHRCRAPRGFKDALSNIAASRGAAVIAEIKRRSPSKGDLAPDLDPAALAADYRDGGATCLSVLTDAEFFGGSVTDLTEARRACALPVLRKDFTVCVNDVSDARLMGADAVLLIVAALSEDELVSLLGVASRLALDCLVEVHDERELRAALACGADLVGVNQRDLRTFDVDTELAVRLAAMIPEDVTAVAESGIGSPQDVSRLASAGFEGVLVGELLVTSKDPTLAVSALTGHRVGPRRPSRAMAGG